jgi:hypothetical protein
MRCTYPHQDVEQTHGGWDRFAAGVAARQAAITEAQAS